MKYKLNKIIFATLMCVAGTFGFISCDDDYPEDDFPEDDFKVENDDSKYDGSGLYLGITGFNNHLDHYYDDSRYFSLLTSSSASEFKSFVNGLDIDISTVLYYAVDNAVTILEKASFPDDLSKVALVTFTDGLDEGSVAYDSKYSDVTAVSEHLKSARVDGKQIEAYAIGLRGNDVVDDAKFRSDLIALASSTSNAIEVSNMSEVDAKFQQLASSLYSESISQSMSLTVPLKPSGVKTRFTFDGALADVESSACYIEGTWDNNGSLTNVTYEGLKCSSGNVVSSSKVDDNITLRTFTFTDIRKTDGGDVSKDNVQAWNKNIGSSVWTPNSEFDPSKSSETIVEQKSAVIMLVLDCSSSLEDSGLDQIKQTVKTFIDALYKNSSPDYCRITFDANGGSGNMSTQMIKKGESTYLNTNTFMPSNNNYYFAGWNTKADGSGTSFSNEKNVSFNTNTTLYAQWRISSGTENGYEWVDLGLPSGLKWATCNVGASSPEEYGSYFAWGETTTKSNYNNSTYTYSSNPTTLPLNQDAAAVKMGGSWRMPTKAELGELRAECTWKWTTQNSVKGDLVTSKTNGNSIFLPAAGRRYNSDLLKAGSYGYYWSSSWRSSSYAYNFYSYSTSAYTDDEYRYYGLSVRGVFSH